MVNYIFEMLNRSFSLQTVASLLIAAAILTFLFARYYYFVSRDRIFRKRSHAVMTGLVNEQFAPLLEGFPGEASDARFIGTPVDYIVFSGLSGNSVEEIVFVEIKTHSGIRLSASERSVRKAIQSGRVRWARFDVNG